MPMVVFSTAYFSSLLNTSAKAIPKKPFRPVESCTVFYKSIKEGSMKPSGLFYIIMTANQPWKIVHISQSLVVLPGNHHLMSV